MTITATVVGSSTLVIGPNGTEKLLVANAAPEEIAVLTSDGRTALQYPAPGNLYAGFVPRQCLETRQQNAESPQGCKTLTILPTK
jgi:hypothetical protein